MNLKLDSYEIIINLVCILLTIPVSVAYAKIVESMTKLFCKYQKKTT